MIEGFIRLMMKNIFKHIKLNLFRPLIRPLKIKKPYKRSVYKAF